MNKQISTDRLIPNSWGSARLIEIAQINPRIDTATIKDNLEVSFIPMKSVEELTGQVDLAEKRAIKKVKKGYTSMIDGDVIFAKITPCMENGKVAVLRGLRNGIAFGSTEFHVIRLKNELSREYLFYYLIQDSVRRLAKRNMTGSVGQKRVPTAYLKSMELPIPPLPEQQRIVAKIEELFSRLEAGVDALKQVQAQLKQYRQAVLKTAVEGRLTAQWREEHRDQLEPASLLLERILQERREKWEAEQLAKYEAKGQTPPRNWREKYREPKAPDTSHLPELPEGWVWGTVDQTNEVIMGQSPPGESYNTTGEGVPLINGPVEFGPTPFSLTLKTKFTTHPTKMCKEEDLILCVRGSTTGRMNIAGFDACLGRGVASIRSNIVQSYLNYYIHKIEKDIFRIGTGSTFPNISQEELKKIPIPVPSLQEQQIIIETVDRLLSIANEISNEIRQQISRADSLRSSTLKRAFAGKLVPQDPEDEPAEVLLERIRAEKEKREGKGKQIEMGV